jgi:murein DD-endopeptidase MepM/ murein hydrolase activator NlpD
MFLSGKNIPTLPKKFFKKQGDQGKSKFFLFFAFFFVLSFSLINIIESSATESSSYSTNRDDLFVYSNQEDVFDKNNITITENSILVQSTPYYSNNQVLGTRQISKERSSIISYKAEQGDTISSIAEMFDISTDTIKWANTITNNTINPEDELLILPVSGVLYYVEKSDSLSTISKKHKAETEDIIAFNNIEDEKLIKPGDALIIPGGEPAPQPVIKPAPTVYYAGSSDFSNVTYGTVTQTPHAGHQNSVDIANSCGTPIYAMNSGTVTKTGSDPALAGNYVWINHGNLNALYGHLQRIYVTPGEHVVAGQQIGLMGNTGYTIGATGCHLHFETRGGQNPFSYLQKGQRM